MTFCRLSLNCSMSACEHEICLLNARSPTCMWTRLCLLWSPPEFCLVICSGWILCSTESTHWSNTAPYVFSLSPYSYRVCKVRFHIFQREFHISLWSSRLIISLTTQCAFCKLFQRCVCFDIMRKSWAMCNGMSPMRGSVADSVGSSLSPCILLVGKTSAV